MHFGGGCKHDQVDKNVFCHKKLLDNFFFNALKVEILFYSTINMKINFHFNNIEFER